MKCTHQYISTHGRCLTCNEQVYPSETLWDCAIARADKQYHEKGVDNG